MILSLKKIVGYNLKTILVAFLFTTFMVVVSSRAFAGAVPMVTFSFCTTPCPETCVGCAPPNTTANEVTDLVNSLRDLLDDLLDDEKDYGGNGVDDLVEGMYEEINDAEDNIIEWFETWFSYSFRPSLQDMTAQWSTAMTDQVRAYGSFLDAESQNFIQTDQQLSEINSQRQLRPSDQVCATGAASGGFSRGQTIVRNMRRARERQVTSLDQNTVGSPTENGKGQYAGVKWAEYQANFCDATVNAGAGCGADGLLPDADIEISTTLFNPLTIDIQTQPEKEVAVRHLIENLVGGEVFEPIAERALTSSVGRDTMLKRRSYMARRAAARSVPEYIAAQRMPGTDMKDFIEGIRLSAGVDIADISDNPSYREVIKALTEEKFLSGKYGTELIDDPSNIAQERLVLSSLYLVRLRDYYELLERIALTLSVQVSVMVDQIPVQGVASGRTYN